MNLPGADCAEIGAAKVRDYLLSSQHPVGRFKAAFFARLGYTRSSWARLRDDLLAVALSGEVTLGEAPAYGQKYEVRATVEGPTGRRADIVSVWIVLKGQDRPRLVTAFPG